MISLDMSRAADHQREQLLRALVQVADQEVSDLESVVHLYRTYPVGKEVEGWLEGARALRKNIDGPLIVVPEALSPGGAFRVALAIENLTRSFRFRDEGVSLPRGETDQDLDTENNQFVENLYKFYCDLKQYGLTSKYPAA
ncbi:MAG: hypothetical protein E6R03_04565 [Hyphomicrobiaceae bacterium]|nr:MAG: hypothetical protein E6R03_04565 [Hyphomicrobiaceae bacterium]